MQSYNVIHLRLERDWVEHCRQLGAKGASEYEAACLRNTLTGGCSSLCLPACPRNTLGIR